MEGNYRLPCAKLQSRHLCFLPCPRYKVVADVCGDWKQAMLLHVLCAAAIVHVLSSGYNT